MLDKTWAGTAQDGGSNPPVRSTSTSDKAMERDPGNGSRRSRGEDRLDYAATGNKAVGCEWMTSLFQLIDYERTP